MQKYTYTQARAKPLAQPPPAKLRTNGAAGGDLAELEQAVKHGAVLAHIDCGEEGESNKAKAAAHGGRGAAKTHIAAAGAGGCACCPA